MKLACVHAIAELALAEQNEEVASAYGDQELSFGPEYIIPKPFDPRLIVKLRLPLQKLQWIQVWQPVQLKISPLISNTSMNSFIKRIYL
ncbi:malic enzyme [Proteus mirabilis]|uniref:Malic enzyme n=1 Tax=Proteus mirabilis TaxID=584 RepID=A0A2X2DE69_PROMI|nr:malic enzyme [Proteus mirabilis]